MKIWQKYLLQKRRSALQNKTDERRRNLLSIHDIERSAKSIKNTQNNTTLARYISYREIEKLTIKDFE